MEEQEPKYKISLRGPGITYEEEVDRAVFDEVHQLMARRRTQGQNSDSSTGGTNDDERREPTLPYDAEGLKLRKFIDTHNARRNPDKIVAVAFFLQEQSGQDKVTRRELQRKLDLAGYRSENFGRDLHWACQVRWLKDLGGQKRLREGKKKAQTLRLTEAGKAAVEAKFDKETLRQSRQPR